MCSALPKPASDLAVVQRKFLRDLSGLESRNAASRAEHFCAPPAGDVERRWHVYTSGYFVRLRDVLAQDYRAIARIAGDDAFSGMVGRYLMACPPRRYDLAMAGERFPGFVGSDALSSSLPFISDLAQLERAVSDCFIAAEPQPLTWNGLREMPSSQAAERSIALQPSARVFRSIWPLRDLWQTAFTPEDDEIDIDLSEKPRCFLVHRNDGEIFVREIDDELATLLQAAEQQGSTLAGLAASLSLGDEPDDVRNFLMLMQRALALSLFTLNPVATQLDDTLSLEV